MLLTIVIVIVAIIGIILLLAAMKPNSFRVERSAVINAPADRVFPKLNDFHEWQAWSPWEKIDPALERTYNGAPSGKGAGYAWKGNKQVGKGRMDILESTSPSSLVIDLQFMEPFAARNKTVFTLTPQGASTDVNWAMTGALPFQMKVMNVFMSMDKMIGKDFEAGLANLKGVCE
jgi:hypothetical protein